MLHFHKKELHVEVSDTYFLIQNMINMCQALLLNPEAVLDKSSSVGNIHVCYLFCFITFYLTISFCVQKFIAYVIFLKDKKAGKFKEWLDCASLIDMKPNTPVMEVFSFLAYETVGQVGSRRVQSRFPLHVYCL